MKKHENLNIMDGIFKNLNPGDTLIPVRMPGFGKSDGLPRPLPDKAVVKGINGHGVAFVELWFGSKFGKVPSYRTSFTVKDILTGDVEMINRTKGNHLVEVM
jgi:hypothetical protein